MNTLETGNSLSRQQKSQLLYFVKLNLKKMSATSQQDLVERAEYLLGLSFILSKFKCNRVDEKKNDFDETPSSPPASSLGSFFVNTFNQSKLVKQKRIKKLSQNSVQIDVNFECLFKNV